MRSTEIIALAAERGVPLTYRQLDLWTRAALITSSFKGDRHGRFRDWEEPEVEVAMNVATLMSAGLRTTLAFELARTGPDTDGDRVVSVELAHRRLRIAVEL